MTDSLLSERETKSNRVDPAHDLMMASGSDRVVEPSAPWMSLAGRDPATSTDQLDRQTSELMSYVQKQNDEIDARQSELNAKLAQLDNELRTARLRTGLDTGTDLLSPQNHDSGIVLDEMPLTQPTSPPTNPTIPTQPEPDDSTSADEAEDVGDSVADAKFQEFEEVERLVAQFSGKVADDSDAGIAASHATTKIAPSNETQECHSVALELDDVEVDVAETQIVDAQIAEADVVETQFIDSLPNVATSDATEEIENVDNCGEVIVHARHIEHPNRTDRPQLVEQRRAEKITHRTSRESFEMPAESTASTKSTSPSETLGHLPHTSQARAVHSESDVQIQAMASSLDASELESERRLLAERKIELDRRKSMLQRMQDETQALHREALEMRLVTEQLWIEISDKAPAENVNELLSALRSRLHEEYAVQQDAVDDRKAELLGLQQLIEQKQDDIRTQSLKLQEWVESRHDEIKSFAAEVDAREMLLDRREHRMRDEFSKWEAQRSAYQTQLQGLLSKLNLAGVSEPTS